MQLGFLQHMDLGEVHCCYWLVLFGGLGYWVGKDKPSFIFWNAVTLGFFHLLLTSGIMIVCLNACKKFYCTETGLAAFHWTYTAMLVPKAMVYLDFVFFLHVNFNVCLFVCLFNTNLLLDWKIHHNCKLFPVACSLVNAQFWMPFWACRIILTNYSGFGNGFNIEEKKLKWKIFHCFNWTL